VDRIFLRKNHSTKYMAVHKDEGAVNVNDIIKQESTKI
jgi:hypothetical protein